MIILINVLICSIEIRDDKINTYLNALKENCSEATELVTFVVPNNRKERYDALKKYTCVDNAGRF